MMGDQVEGFVEGLIEKPKNSLLILCTNSYVVNTKIRIIIIFKTDFLSAWQFVTHKSIKHCTDAFIAEKLEQN